MLVFILGGALILGVCIFIHELGHYLLGLAVGVRAEIFSIGYGRGIWKRKLGGTTWQITAIPLGGYVKFTGDDLYGPRVKGGFFSVPPLKRIIPVMGGPLANLLLGFVVFLLLHSLSGPPAPRIALDDFGVQMPATRDGLQNGDRVLAINGSPVGDYNDIVQNIALAEGAPLTFRLERNGQQIERTVTPDVTESGLSYIGIRQPGDRHLSVTYPNGEVWSHRFRSIFSDARPPRSIRAMEYLHDGDVILSVEGQPVSSVPELQAILGTHHGEVVSIEVERETLPWLAPWPTHTETVAVPSSAEFMLRFQNLVDLKYGTPVDEQLMTTMRDDDERALAYVKVNGEPAISFRSLYERFGEARPAEIKIGDQEYRGDVFVERTGMLGFRPLPMVEGEYLPGHASMPAVLSAAYQDTIKNIMVYPAFFASLFSGRMSLIENAAGPVRIFGLAGILVKSGYRQYLQLFAAISIALFIMNLIPFPIVDGGHVVFFLYEAIAGRPLSQPVMEAIHKFGFSAILLFGLWIMYRDLLWAIGL